MKPTGHLIASGVLAALAHGAGAPGPACAAILAGGVLIDTDHVLDYYLFARNRSLDPRRVYAYHLRMEYERVLFLFHAYELLLVMGALALLVASPLLWGLVVGMTLHLALDVVFNAPIHRHPIVFYAIPYRLRHRGDIVAMEVRLGDGGPPPDRRR